MNKNIKRGEGYNQSSKQRSFTSLIALGLSPLLSGTAIANTAILEGGGIDQTFVLLKIS
ncbi:Uncharacterised protein [Helicobacter cholecystus]|uniref:hypothetical protein n=1 Tax=Helicobacter cholecystus TaxID=45498 RepID=UPI000F6BE24B|nr:hypothetical protein [Helicobacter cholecystus]VEJ25829.1 Uncharacterised protein [Helicobacter cholecystus]